MNFDVSVSVTPCSGLCNFIVLPDLEHRGRVQLAALPGVRSRAGDLDGSSSREEQADAGDRTSWACKLGQDARLSSTPVTKAGRCILDPPQLREFGVPYGKAFQASSPPKCLLKLLEVPSLHVLGILKILSV